MNMFFKSSLIALCLAVAMPSAFAQSNADGTWAVTLVTQKGDCAPSLSSQIQVRDGRVERQSLFLNVSGDIGASGNVALRVVRGSDAISASGSVRGENARGVWSSPTSNCSGSWTAMRS